MDPTRAMSALAGSGRRFARLDFAGPSALADGVSSAPSAPSAPRVVAADLPCSAAPKIVFIVPYRDRAVDLESFSRKMRHILEDVPADDYRIYYAHQLDERAFNRGAMKNIGFIAMRQMYPSSYKNITFVFNDVDTTPAAKDIINYETAAGVIKHFYGFTFTLGGIVSITGGDFEALNGFINMWAWGFEDNALNDRAIARGIHIDRSTFFPVSDKNIDISTNGYVRTVNRGEFAQFRQGTTEGITSIRDLAYEIDESSGFINVSAFNTGRDENKLLTSQYDLRDGPVPFKNQGRPHTRPAMKMLL